METTLLESCHFPVISDLGDEFACVNSAGLSSTVDSDRRDQESE